MTAATGVRWQVGDSIKGEQKAGDGESRESFGKFKVLALHKKEGDLSPGTQGKHSSVASLRGLWPCQQLRLTQ